MLSSRQTSSHSAVRAKPQYIEIIKWLVNDKDVRLGTKGIIWLDEISFY